MSLDHDKIGRLEELAEKGNDEKALDIINNIKESGFLRSTYLKIYFERKAYYRQHKLETDRPTPYKTPEK